MDNTFLLNFVSLTIFSLMLAIGVNHSLQQLIYLWRKPELLLRSLLAVIVLVPLLVIVLLLAFDLPPAVATGLAVLAAAPGAPLTTKRSQMAGGDDTYAASLQLTLALLAVIVTPLILAAFYAIFELETERVTPFKVAEQILLVTFLPVAIGLFLRHFAPGLVTRIGKPLNLIANILFFLLIAVMVAVFVFVPDARTMLELEWLSIMVIVIMVLLSLFIGHWLGGPDRHQRAALAIAGIARNIGLAMLIASLGDIGYNFIPTLLTYVILGAVLAIPYAVWIKRQAA